MTPITKILEHLYFGNSRSARDENILRQNNITASVNVAKDLNDPWIDGVKSYKIGLMDGNHPDNKHGYIVAAQLVIYLMRQGERVLLHCHEGRSRSVAVGAIAMAYGKGNTRQVNEKTDGELIAVFSHSVTSKERLEEAYKEIKEERPEVFVKDDHWRHMEEALRELEAINKK